MGSTLPPDPATFALYETVLASVEDFLINFSAGYRGIWREFPRVPPFQTMQGALRHGGSVIFTLIYLGPRRDLAGPRRDLAIDR